jgi:hypothetical protein
MAAPAHQLLRIALAGFGDIEEWKLGDVRRAAELGYPRRVDAPLLDDFGTLFLDFTLDARDGTPVCHEVNGPNAVGSDALTGDSALRSELELRQALRRARQMGLLGADGRALRPFVTLHAHQHWAFFRTGGEFYPRVGDFFERTAAALPACSVRLRAASEPLGDEHVSVVAGDVPSIARDLALAANGERFEYQGRPVAFIGNPNLVPELLRTRKLSRGALRASTSALRAFHAWRLVEVVHDKARQQEYFAGTPVRPLRCFEAWSAEAACEAARALLAHGPVVVKPNGGSGGAGVHALVPEMDDAQVRARVDAVVRDCVRKYGDNAETSALPIRGFEFVRSTGSPLPDGEHLWDLRIALLFEPGTAWLFPVSMRLAPAPFDAHKFHLERDQWISNVSGRDVTLLKSGMDAVALAQVGVTPAKLDEIFEACVRWTLRAWDASVRDGGFHGAVYEDECELDDPDFYPQRKFRT